MKRDLQKLIAFLAMLFLPFALLAQYVDAAYGIRIDESFEKGIPADWTQENVKGSVNWVGESQNLTYPTGAADSLARVAFRNTSGVTNKAVTRLILPPVEVASLFQPILIFSHAQDKWSGDFDSLRILCRTSADGEWKTLTAYDNYIARWQRDTIFLPSAAYCQIAFEAADNLGRGVVIDDVVIRSTPSCFNPEDLYTSNVTNSSITVNWMGSFDAEYFYVKLSKDSLTAAELESSATELVCDSTTDGVSMDFEGLIQGTKYYCYVRSQCEHEISGWASIEFKTANILEIPAVVDFNMPDDPNKKGQFAYMDGWWYAAAIADYKPYVNAYGTDWKWGASIDGSGSLVFTHYLSSGKPTPQCYMGALPAGTWAYAATPEINANVKDLQISFETFIYYRYVADQFGITVGVMTDPEDRSTFVPVKTIINDRPFIYDEYTVSFEDYTGEGKYIAFMSDFEKSNHFTIENLTIEPRRDTPEALQYDIMMPTASTMKFKFEQTCDAYEVVISNSEYDIDRHADFPDTLSVLSKHTIQNMGAIEDLTPDANYYVYVRGVKGDKKGKWAYPRYVEMPSRLDYNTLPYVMDFEGIPTTSSVDINGYGAYSASMPNVIKPLYTYTSNTFKMSDSTEWTGTSYRLPEQLSKTEFRIGCYWPYHATTIAVFPELDMSKTKVSFYAVGRMSSKSYDPTSAAYQKNYKSKAAIGVMADANDINSFIAIDTIEPSFEEYTYYEYDFSLYPEAKGKFFAIKVEEFEYTHTSVTSYTNNIHVDNVTFAKSLDCKNPSEMVAEVDAYDPSKATITWSANGVTEWNLKVATTEYDKSQFGTNGDFEFVFDGKVTEPKAVLTGLQYPNKTYYYWLQPLCDGVGADWTVARSFETFCPAVHTVPYTQDFDNVTAVGSNVWDGFAAECMYTKQWNRAISGLPSNYKNKYYYPYVTNTRAYNGNNSLPLFRKYTTSSRNYVALPLLDKPIDSLQITFRLYSLKTSVSYWNSQELAVGVMTDPMDITTFEQVALVKPSKATTWERVLVKFNEYKGQGKYIAIRETDKYTSSPEKSSEYICGTNTDSVYIDNIEVNVAPPCDIPYDIFASDVTPNTAKLNWKSDAETFVVVVANKALTFPDLVDFDDYKAGNLANFAHAASIVSVDTVVGAKNLKLTTLTVNQDYYVYIKSFCLGMYTDYSDAYTFSTFCPALSPETFLGDFNNATSGTVPDCWFAGKTIGAYQGTNTITSYVKAATGMTAYGQGVMIKSTKGNIVSTTGQPDINGTYIITPSLDIDQISKYKVKFKAYTTTSYMYTGCGTNDYARSIIVGVVTNPYDMSTFTPIKTVENIHHYSYPYEVYLDDYVCDLNGDTGKFVAFYSNFAIQNQVYLDDIELELIDSCPRFNGQVEGTTPSSVTIKFDEVPASYEVKAATSALTTAAAFERDTLNLLYPSTLGTSNTITIEGLQNHKEYFFFARSTVDSTCQDWKLVLSAYPADSLEKAIPFIDDFESNSITGMGILPYDWYGYYSVGSDNRTYPATGSTSYTGGTRGAYSTISSGYTYLVSPKLKVDKLSDCYLEYQAYTGGASSSFAEQPQAYLVGVVSDPNNIEATFEVIDTVIITAAERGAWRYNRIDLTKYAGNAKHIAFKIDADLTKVLYPSYGYTSIYLDNVVVDYIPACYEPNSFSINNITDRSIDLSFKHEGALKYEAMYAVSGQITDPTSDSLYSEVKIVSFEGTQLFIESLYSEMPYDVYVRAICNEKDTSNWAFAGKYTTLPSLISDFPYNNDFSDLIENANWKHKRSSGRGWYMGVDADSLVADQKNSTDSALYFSYDNGVSADANNKTGSGNTYRYVNLAAGTYQISYDWVVPGTPKLTTLQALFEQNLCRVLLMPSTVSMTSASGFKTKEGRSISFSYIDPLLSNIPADWFDLSDYHDFGGKEYGALFGSDLSLPLEQQWQRHTSTITITKEMEGTYMLVFFFYGGSKADITADGYRAAVIDNLSIVKSECATVLDVKVDDFTTNTVTLSWNTSDPTVASYDVVVLNADVDPATATDAQKAYTGTVTSTSTTISGLNPFTKYYVCVRPTCSSQYNFWTLPVEFTTDVKVADGYTFSFEEDEMLYYPSYTDSHMWEFNGDKAYNNIITLFHKWLTASTTSTSSIAKFSKTYASYHPQVAQDTLRNGTKYSYGRTGEHSLWFGSRSTNLVGATVALPYAGEFEGRRLVFYMRGFATSTSSTGTTTYPSNYYPTQFSSSVALNNQSRKITVGTMTDPNDATTFVALDTVQYPYTNTDYSTSTNLKQKDASGDMGWYRVVLSLDNAKGKYIAFRYEYYGTTTIEKSLNMYIDDVTVEQIPECPAPELMTITKLGESSITVDYSYEGTPTTYVEVATDEEFTNVVASNTFTSLPFTVTGLQPLTKYYMRAKVICSDLDESEYSLTREFETPTAVCYDLNFDNEATHYPANWQHSFGPSIAGFIKATSSFSFNTPSSGNTYGWKVKPALFASGKFSSAKNFTAIPSSQTNSTIALWALSPVIELDETADQHLSFDLALTEKGNNNPVDFTLMTGDTTMTFMVSIIDATKGYVYSREDATIWKPAGSLMDPEYDFCAIPHRGAEYSIDLSKYKGKNIQILLCYFLTQNIDLHLDNFHVNKYATKEYDASTCEFCDFEDNDFFILSSNTQLGENKFSKWQLNSENSDTLLVLNLNVTDAPETDVDAAICAGSVYNENGFTGLMQTGVYRQKFTSKNGCDSIVTLALNVVEPQHTTIIDTVCFGTTYTFAGQELNRTGMYVDSLISKVTGCDSIVTLLLTVKDVIRKDAYVNICFGDTYKFGKQTISASGTYEEVFKTVDGCDSLVTLHATVLPDYRQTINAVIKEGEEYNASGFVGLTAAGEYTLPLKSVDGCDSTVTLILKVLTDVSKQVSVNICFGDSYVFGSQTITESGEYVEVFKAADGGDSTVILTATVLPDLRQTISATICAGEVYNENGFSNLKETGVYTLPLKSVDGCDSTVTLNLTVLSGDTTYIEKTITTEELPYEYQTIRYDKSTLPGTYVDTIVVKTSGCEEVIIHKLTVESTGVGVENTFSRDLIMVPNPVAVNGTLYINAEFTSEERNGLLVEVFNAIGQCVYSDRPTVYPIEVSGLAERGMYIVRIITGDGKSYQGKIIVE